MSIEISSAIIILIFIAIVFGGKFIRPNADEDHHQNMNE